MPGGRRLTCIPECRHSVQGPLTLSQWRLLQLHLFQTSSAEFEAAHEGEDAPLAVEVSEGIGTDKPDERVELSYAILKRST
jgi:hypothetical protein